MSTSTQRPTPNIRRTLAESETPFHDLNGFSAADKRELCRPRGDDQDAVRFWLFCNLVSLNYLDVRATEWEWVPQHARDWHTRIHTHPLNVILAGRKHTKTTWVLSEILYACQYQQGYAALYWANTESQVNERMEELEEMVEANPWLNHLHDGGECCGARQHKVFQNESRLHTTWVTGAAEGAHVNLSIGDDPLKEIGGTPDEEIEAWYSKVIEPMLNRGGAHVIVGTRKRPTDLYEILRTKNEDREWDLPGYQLAEYPAIREPWLDKYADRSEDLAPADLYSEVEAPQLADALGIASDSVSILWPEGRPADWLKRKLGAMGVPYFIREFCMVFSQVEDAIIAREAIDEQCSVPEDTPYMASPGSPESPYTRTVVGVDPASSKGSDRASYVTLGIRPSGVRGVLDVFNAESIKPSRFKSKLQELDTRYSPSDIVIEDNGMQVFVVEDAVEFDRSLPITDATTSARKHSWEDGIPRIAHRVTQGGYRFYREADDHTEQLINALTSLTMDEGKLVGHTPDPVSALYMAEHAIDSTVPSGSIDLCTTDAPEEFESEDAEGNELVDAVMGVVNERRRMGR